MKLEDLSGIAVVFLLLALILGIGSTILDSVKETSCGNVAGFYFNATDHDCYNSTFGLENTDSTAITEQGELALGELSGWQTTLAVIVVAAVVIGVIGYFYAGKRQ